MRNTTIDPAQNSTVKAILRSAAALDITLPADVTDAQRDLERVHAARAAEPTKADLRDALARKVAAGDKITTADRAALAAADDMAAVFGAAERDAFAMLKAAIREYAEDILEEAEGVALGAWEHIAALAETSAPGDTVEGLVRSGRPEAATALVEAEKHRSRLAAAQSLRDRVAAVVGGQAPPSLLTIWDEVPPRAPASLADLLDVARAGICPRFRTPAQVAALLAERKAERLAELEATTKANRSRLTFSV